MDYCKLTNRLCIEQPEIEQLTPIDIFYPNTLIPIDLLDTTLKLKLFGDFPSTNPCSLDLIPLKLFNVTPQKTNETIIDKVTVTVGELPKHAFDQFKVFHFVLGDDDGRICILGPNLKGVFSESVQISNLYLILDEQLVVPDSELPPPLIPITQEQKSENSLNVLFIVFVVLGVLTLGFAIAWLVSVLKQLRKNNTKMPDSVQEETLQRSNSMDILVDPTYNDAVERYLNSSPFPFPSLLKSADVDTYLPELNLQSFSEPDDALGDTTLKRQTNLPNQLLDGQMLSLGKKSIGSEVTILIGTKTNE
jgi:hypothetical protein